MPSGIKSFLYYAVMLVFTPLYSVFYAVVFFVTVAFDRQRVVLHHVSRFWTRAIFFPLGWKLRFEGLEHIEKKRAYVVIGNHQSMFDIPLMYQLPVNFKWVSKRAVYKWPIFGMALWMHGDIAIERGAASSAKKMIRKAKQHLDAGTSVIIFPEGTRTDDCRMLPRFKEGAFLMAKTAGVGILPCVSEGTGSLNEGWKLRFPHRFTVRILPPVSPERVQETDLKTLTAEMYTLIRSEHEKLRPDLYAK